MATEKRSIDKVKMWESLNKDTQEFIRSLTTSGITIRAIQNNKGEVWKK